MRLPRLQPLVAVLCPDGAASARSLAGCGGLTQGFVATGHYNSVGAVEKERDAAATFALNFGEHVHVGDIHSWSRGSLPLAEVVVGGPPCQGFSNLGNRDSLDPRNALWRRYMTVLEKVRPAFLENVPQFLDGAEYQALEREAAPLGRLARCEWRRTSWMRPDTVPPRSGAELSSWAGRQACDRSARLLLPPSDDPPCARRSSTWTPRCLLFSCRRRGSR